MPALEAYPIGELPNKRTSNSKHFLMSDGSYQAVISMGDVHYQDNDGNWYNIDTDLFDEADFDMVETPVSKHMRDSFLSKKDVVRQAKAKGVLDRAKFDFHALKVPFSATIPRQFRKGYSVGKGMNKLTFKPVGASPSVGSQSEDNRAIMEYQDVWNDTDVKLELTTSGIKETIILKSNVAPASFSFEVIGDLAGEFQITPAWLQDANGERRDVTQTIRQAGAKTYIDLTADVSGLAYPIMIDPTASLYNTMTSVADQANPTTANGNGAIASGINLGASQIFSYLKFDLSSITGVVTAAQITLKKNSYSGFTGNTYASIRAHRITSTWGINTTWNTKPTFDSSKYGASLNVLATAPAFTAYNMDVTTLVNDIKTTGVDNGFGIYPNVYDGDGYQLAFANNNDATNKPVLSVTYNTPPTAPIVTAPNGGETWNAQHTITWTASTDPETAQASLQYQIQYSGDNGVTWTDIIALTAAGATSYVYDFTSKAQTSTAKIRMRAYDGTSYGPWDESNGVFTIQHNAAPTAPTNLYPNSGIPLDRAVVQRLSWTHNDPQVDPQAKFDLQWRKQGDVGWNTVTQTSINQYWDAPANAFPRGSIEWQVRTYDQAGLSGPYSAQATYFAGDAPANPTITSGATAAVARPVIEWSSFGQTAYQVKADQGAATAWDTGEVASGNKAQTVGVDLANNSNYTVSARIKNADGLWSPYDSKLVTVSYSPPPAPVIALTGEGVSGRIIVAITNPAPSGSEPAVSGNDVYRRDNGEQEWIRIAVGIAANGMYNDYAVGSGQIYEYFVRAYGDNGTFKDSAVQNGSITLSGVWLHDVADPIGTIRKFTFDGGGRNDDWQAEGELMKFAGRRLPVARIGDATEERINVTLQMLRDGVDRAALDALIRRRATLCYRDGRGRKAFGVVLRLPMDDERFGYSTNFQLDQIDYSEGV